MISFESGQVWKAQGRGLSLGVVAPAGRVVHLTGQVAWDRNEVVVGVGDVEVQARQAFANIAALLGEAGGTVDDIVSLTTWYTAAEHLPAIQRVRAEHFGSGGPASTSVMVAGLGHPDFLVEFTPVAVILSDRFISPA